MTQVEKEKLSNEIKLQRFKTKKTQEDCAKALCMSVPTYKNIEDNPDKMSIDYIIRLSDFLDFNLLKFFLNDVLQTAI